MTCIYIFIQPPQVPFPCSFDILPDKRQVVTALAQYINRSLRDWNNQRLSDIARFCINNHKQFLEFKVCRKYLQFIVSWQLSVLGSC